MDMDTVSSRHEMGILKPQHKHRDSLALLRKGQVVLLPAASRAAAGKLRASLVSSLRRWIKPGERLSTTVLEEHPEHRDPFPRVEAVLEPYFTAHIVAPETQRKRAKKSSRRP